MTDEVVVREGAQPPAQKVTLRVLVVGRDVQFVTLDRPLTRGSIMDAIGVDEGYELSSGGAALTDEDIVALQDNAPIAAVPHIQAG